MPKRPFALVSSRGAPNVQTRSARVRVAENAVNDLFKMQSVYRNVRGQLASHLDDSIKTDLLHGEDPTRIAEFLDYHGSISEELFEYITIRDLATRVRPEKAKQVLEKWLSTDVVSQAGSLMVISQLKDVYGCNSHLLKYDELPKCIQRLSFMDGDTFWRELSVDDVKQVCDNFKATKVFVDGRYVKVSAEQLAGHARRLCDVLADFGERDGGFLD